MTTLVLAADFQARSGYRIERLPRYMGLTSTKPNAVMLRAFVDPTMPRTVFPWVGVSIHFAFESGEPVRKL